MTARSESISKILEANLPSQSHHRYNSEISRFFQGTIISWRTEQFQMLVYQQSAPRLLKPGLTWNTRCGSCWQQTLALFSWCCFWRHEECKQVSVMAASNRISTETMRSQAELCNRTPNGVMLPGVMGETLQGRLQKGWCITNMRHSSRKSASDVPGNPGKIMDNSKEPQRAAMWAQNKSYEDKEVFTWIAKQCFRPTASQERNLFQGLSHCRNTTLEQWQTAV